MYTLSYICDWRSWSGVIYGVGQRGLKRGGFSSGMNELAAVGGGGGGGEREAADDSRWERRDGEGRREKGDDDDDDVVR
jgi:hypothetical protein